LLTAVTFPATFTQRCMAKCCCYTYGAVLSVVFLLHVLLYETYWFVKVFIVFSPYQTNTTVITD